VLKIDDGIIVKCCKEFEEHFRDIQMKEDRNFAITNVYYDGQSQVNIALISKVIKSGDSF